MLESQQLNLIHEAGLELLARAGILLDDVHLRQALAERGCRVHDRRVWIPETVVEETLAQAPRSFSLYDRDGSPVLTLGPGCRTASNSGVAPRIWDLETGELRPSTLQDVVDSTRVLDALPHIGTVAATLVEPTDTPPAVAILKGFEATLRNTTKPIMGPGPTNATEACYAIRLGAAVQGGLDALVERPFFAPWVCPVSPLTFPANLVGALRACAEAGLPLGLVTNPVTGLTAPLTMAGALAQMHAELLAAIVLTYQIKPGLPIIYKGAFSIADMRTLATLGGGPEIGLAKATAVLLGKHCGLPVTGFGLASMAGGPGFQFGYEKAANGLLCVLAAPDILGGVGISATGTVASYEALVLEHELVTFLWRIADSVSVNDETLAVGVVCDMMDGQSPVTHPHTLAHLRDEAYWKPTLGQDLLPDEWLTLGEPVVIQRAREQVHRILDGHIAPTLSPETEATIVELMQDAEQVLH